MRRTIAVLFGVVLVTSVAGCSSGSSKSASPTSSDGGAAAATSVAVSGVCDAVKSVATSGGSELDDPQLLGKLADALRKVTPPAGQEKQFTDWVNNLDAASKKSGAQDISDDPGLVVNIAVGFGQFGAPCLGASASDLSNLTNELSGLGASKNGD